MMAAPDLIMPRIISATRARRNGQRGLRVRVRAAAGPSDFNVFAQY
jgi:hypothetical protein